MKLGGFVIHGNNVATLPACLDSLLSVCDVVVAVDSLSTDGSAEADRQRGVERVALPWQGYGAARSAAAARLHALGCDWQFFLDSDEWLEPPAVDALRRWKSEPTPAPAYSLVRHDWAYTRTGRFLFRRNRRKRLFSRAMQTWTPKMIVHEAVHGTAVHLPIAIEHRFAVDWEERSLRNETYALLWAVQAHAEHRATKPQQLQRVAHVIKGALVDGAVLRGGGPGVKLAWRVSEYHARKHHYLQRLRRGEYQDLAQLYADGRLEELFRAVSRLMTPPARVDR